MPHREGIMPTLQGGDSPGKRLGSGDRLLEAAKAVDTRAVKERLGRFQRAHQAFRAEQARVEAADDRLRQQQAHVGDADAAQDEAVQTLASALAGDGLPRVNPFKPIGFQAPAVIVKLGYAEEAAVVTRLARAAEKRKGASKATVAAARAAARAAAEVQRTLKDIRPLTEARRAAIARRDASGQEWETAFAALKRGARAAVDDGATGLFAALFEQTAPARPRKAKKAAPAGAAPAGAAPA
jgi:hypothetical protein